jgi:MtN3 and saliva related transmembrane protein
VDLAETIGYVAALLTSVAFLPQVIHVWTTRSGRDISFAMYAVFIAGVSCWLIYGLLLEAWPVVVANAVTLVLASTVLALKLLFEGRAARAHHGKAHAD